MKTVLPRICAGFLIPYSVLILACVFPGAKATADGCPIVIDFDRSGKIETTGSTTGIIENTSGQFLGTAVQFDLDGNGYPEWVEWISSPGDGFLIDNRDSRAEFNLNGHRLFGNASPDHANGFEKLAEFDANSDGSISGIELEGLQLWFDRNLDGQYQAGEFETASAVGLISISLAFDLVSKPSGETLLISSAETEAGSIYVEDVFFGEPSRFGNNLFSFAPVLAKLSGLLS